MESSGFVDFLRIFLNVKIFHVSPLSCTPVYLPSSSPNHIMQKLVDGEQSVKRGRQLARKVLTQQRIAHKVETGAN